MHIKTVLSSAILSFLLCSTSATAQYSPQTNTASSQGGLAACDNATGYQSTYQCLANMMGRLTLGVQMFRYVLDEDVRAETSLVKSALDAWCAVGLLRSVDTHLANVDNVIDIRNGKHSNEPNGVVKAAWEAYEPRKNNVIENKTWSGDLAPDIVKIKVNESPLYWFQGPARALAREQLTGEIDPDATMKDITSSICSAKIQNDWMGWGKKKSLFSAVTENFIWDGVVKADGKINKYGTYSDALFKAQYDGKTAITSMMDNIKEEVNFDMKDAVPADKLKANNILTELKQVFTDATNNMSSNNTTINAGGTEQGIRDFDQRVNNVVNMGKYFDEDSAIRQHTETLGYFLSELRTQYRGIVEKAKTATPSDVDFVVPPITTAPPSEAPPIVTPPFDTPPVDTPPATRNPVIITTRPIIKNGDTIIVSPKDKCKQVDDENSANANDDEHIDPNEEGVGDSCDNDDDDLSLIHI